MRLVKLHPWGCCQPGTWKLVRVVTETLDEGGRVIGSSTTETKTTLVAADRDGITLEIQASMEVAGKRFQAEPQTVKQGFHGESSDAQLAPKQPSRRRGGDRGPKDPLHGPAVGDRRVEREKRHDAVLFGDRFSLRAEAPVRRP